MFPVQEQLNAQATATKGLDKQIKLSTCPEENWMMKRVSPFDYARMYHDACSINRYFQEEPNKY